MVRKPIHLLMVTAILLATFPLIQTFAPSPLTDTVLGSGFAAAIEDNGYDCAHCGYNPVCHLYCYVEHFFECGLDPDCWDEY